MAEWEGLTHSRKNKDLGLKTRRKPLIETPSEFPEFENALFSARSALE
jgi:hypothetical protein